ncbi:hypothetical protein FOZ60_002166 [Perkinsus olseni]|uniref:Uncharacterized protein n=1 Tax=Perkinsus olseni TaxID=32597 RepID=A0A7J6NZQ9_PEROL|nr:hypothetical protein FOZ60_002166 [Perkinsus olseni]
MVAFSHFTLTLASVAASVMGLRSAPDSMSWETLGASKSCTLRYAHHMLIFKASESNKVKDRFIEATLTRNSEMVRAKYITNGTFECEHVANIKDEENNDWFHHVKHKRHLIIGNEAAKYPFSSIFEPIMGLLANGVNGTICSSVADYIERNPRGKFRSEHGLPWLRQYLIGIRSGWELA